MSGDNEPVMLTMRDVRRIDRVVTAIEHSPLLSQSQPTVPVPPQTIWYWGKIATGSALVSGSLEAPTACAVNVWVPRDLLGSASVSAGAGSGFVMTNDATLLGLTVINRSSMSGPAGTMVKIEYAWGEWSIKWADC